MTHLTDENGVNRAHRKLVGTLNKGLAVLQALAQYSGVQGRTLTEISELVDLNMTTTSRILRTLLDWGYVRRVDERYNVGLEALALGKAVLESLDLRQETRPVLEELTREVEQTCHLGVLDRGEIIYIDKTQPSTPIQMRSRIGDRMPAHSTALGKATLAFSSEDVVAAVLAKPLSSQTPNTVVRPDELRQQLEEIRHRGYAIDDQENEEGVICLGAPIFNHRGHVIAALSISSPASSLNSERLSELGPRLCQAASSISKRLGYRPFLQTARLSSFGRDL